MALTPTDNEAFLREVDENLRRDQMTGLAKKWGSVIGVLVLVLLIALGGFLWWRNHRAEQAGMEGEKLSQLIGDVDIGRAQPTDKRIGELASSPHDGYRAMARLTQAGITAKTDPVAAAANYQAIARDEKLPQATRDLALIRATTLQFDTLPPSEVVSRLKPLAVPNAAWFGSAGELTAIAYLKMGRRDLAGPLFAAIARDTNVPTGLRGRAAGMATGLGQTVGVITPQGAPKE
ncbi:tetratricopeptide repeat protein [Sphingomonas crusticola]|uniref:tetratricopeptide repeat protein n=1 Tax=Sphingomonas crusticola TaxID=1697973 RepID=UPI000E269E17|nr:tetratricopeptide repeat protein [Sphingomonas crusticola]